MLECRLGFMLRCLLQNTAGPSRLSLSSNHSCSTPLDSFQQQCSRMAVAAFVPARRKHLSDWISLSLVYYVFVSLWRVGYKVVPPFIFTKRRWDAVKHNVFGHRLLWWFSTPVIKFSALTNSFSPLSLIFQRIVIWHTRTYTYSSRPLSCFFFFEEKGHQPLFVSLFFTPIRTHASCIGCVVSPVQDSCTGVSIPEISSMPAYTPQLAPMHTHTSEAISHSLWTTSPPPPPKHTHTCTHVIAALVPSSPPCCAWANSAIHSASIHSPSTTPLTRPPVFCHYSCVSAVGLSQSSQRWSRNTEGLQGRQPGLSVSPSCHSHFRLPLIRRFVCSLLLHHWQSYSTRLKVKCAHGDGAMKHAYYFYMMLSKKCSEHCALGSFQHWRHPWNAVSQYLSSVFHLAPPQKTLSPPSTIIMTDVESYLRECFRLISLSTAHTTHTHTTDSYTGCRGHHVRHHLLIGSNNRSYAPFMHRWKSQWEQIEAQYLAKGPFDLEFAGAVNWTTVRSTSWATATSKLKQGLTIHVVASFPGTTN